MDRCNGEMGMEVHEVVYWSGSDGVMEWNKIDIMEGWNGGVLEWF